VEKTGRKRPWKSLRDFHFSHSFNNNKLDDRNHFLQNAKTSVASLRRLITPTRNADHDQPGTLITFIGIRKEMETFTYIDFLADFRGKFHDIRNDPSFGNCLDGSSYNASQRLARSLLEGGSAGVVYPSVRHKAGTCIVCFRPALVSNVRKGSSISIAFENSFATPEIRKIK